MRKLRLRELIKKKKKKTAKDHKARKRYGWPVNPELLVTTGNKVIYPQPFSTSQPYHVNHHFPKPPGRCHTPAPLHTFPEHFLEKCSKDPTPISACALSHQAKLCHAYDRYLQDIPSRAKAKCYHFKTWADVYTFACGQQLTQFSGEENWEARGKRWKLISLCPLVASELCEYTNYSK